MTGESVNHGKLYREHVILVNYRNFIQATEKSIKFLKSKQF